MAFEQIEGPILLHERLDVAGALIAFVSAKSHGAKNIRLKDFLPKWDREVVEQTPEQLGKLMEEMTSLPSPHSSSMSSGTPPA